MQECALIRVEWQDPLAVLDAHADDAFVLALLSGGEGARARWSYLARDPDAVVVIGADDARDPFDALRDLLGPTFDGDPAGPPFQGGVAGLCAYELGARAEGVDLVRNPDFPDAVFARYPALLAFDQLRQEVIAVGRGADDGAARREAERALSWLVSRDAERPSGPLGDSFVSTDGDAYESAVAEVVARITAGEIFQANIARRWTGRLLPGVRPFDVAARLAVQSPAPFAAYLRLEGLAVVSNSPERFLSITPGKGGNLVESRPIKGTAPRGATQVEDRALAQALSMSAKDRAENLMIVDLMRNDLSRVCRSGEVEAPELYRVETYANVHHLVSLVHGVLADGAGAAEVLRATFPPGSITGAPKVQAMKVIEGLEPPRGPFFGAMFWAGVDGAMDANVMIRTVAFTPQGQGWSFEARAGGGIVADSEPLSERAETEAKISALRRAILGDRP